MSVEHQQETTVTAKRLVCGFNITTLQLVDASKQRDDYLLKYIWICIDFAINQYRNQLFEGERDFPVWTLHLIKLDILPHKPRCIQKSERFPWGRGCQTPIWLYFLVYARLQALSLIPKLVRELG